MPGPNKQSMLLLRIGTKQRSLLHEHGPQLDAFRRSLYSKGRGNSDAERVFRMACNEVLMKASTLDGRMVTIVGMMKCELKLSSLSKRHSRMAPYSLPQISISTPPSNPSGPKCEQSLLHAQIADLPCIRCHPMRAPTAPRCE